jgi:glycosyltransferase involved in cell wall biosynthesis
MTPTVSFVVPCYKLAHLLGQCVNSILGQTYADFEILIMDDCSPDRTPEVAQSFRDVRVKYIRNDPNLGHLRNYNKGINLTRGKYVWLISADDYLRRPYILERYVGLLEKNPRVGYAFCPGVAVKNGLETEVLGYSVQGDRDRIIDGTVFLKTLLITNSILSASGMARRECYEKISFFPLDKPWAGDWYLWCLYALHFDVAYFAEPMVCYREHELSMTNTLTVGKPEACAVEDVEIPWALREKAQEAGNGRVARFCFQAVAREYTRASVGARRYGTPKRLLTLEGFEESLCRHTGIESERDWIRARVYAGIGDGYYWGGETGLAKQFYLSSWQKNPRMVTALAKWLLLSVGKPGDDLRRGLRSFREKNSIPGPSSSIAESNIERLV